MSTKLILDTDIGSDVDDAWALALCLASDEIDLVGVTLVHADLDTRARIALKMLKLAGRSEVPVYKGLSNPLTPNTPTYWAGHEGTETDFSDIEGMRANEGAVEFILETVARHPGEVVVCPVGPMTNVAEAIRRSPETMRKARRLAVMGLTFAGEGPSAAAREHNACVDPVATKRVVESGIPATIVGLNVTTQVLVRLADLERVQRSPFGDYLAAMTRQYCGLCGRDHTYMHDPLAVATEIDPSVVTTRRMSAEVREDGCAVFSSGECGNLSVCTDVDAGKFEELLLSRIGARFRPAP